MSEDILNANNRAGKSACIFGSKEIERATNNFSKENLLGAGSFGDQVNHRSLVQLLGCCIELDQPVLIYEYVSNGTLFDHLHDRSGKCGSLNWPGRLTIAHQTADGLAYLHNLAVPRIYHRDLTDKSNVYSFRVVLLKLLTSKKAIDFNREEEDVNLAVYVKKILREESEQSGVRDYEGFGVRSLAVACLDDRRQNRPSMKQVAEEIKYVISIVVNEVLVPTN
ncbi:hypothetical protein TIFTF001_054726 [Ficus carica]|uniref:Protein kinase domain-containing protein n=1 Tax=Ficus carica TaxID=3494 RepID=A0AA88ECY4_FICCA|nr:hypothetical protein TIFTF001_054726 [Ficus carica]